MAIVLRRKYVRPPQSETWIIERPHPPTGHRLEVCRMPPELGTDRPWRARRVEILPSRRRGEVHWLLSKSSFVRAYATKESAARAAVKEWPA